MLCVINRPLKNAHLLRFAHPSSLRRTGLYASFLGISQALHLGMLSQPVNIGFFNTLREVMVMATNLQIDDKLIQKAVRLGGHKTKKAAVSKALIEYIQNLEQEEILSMFGTVEYDPEYDYKEQRRQP